jgi:rod shape-determining protein MreB and related proteins
LRFTPELGIDLGTANLHVYRRGKGVVLSEPTVVALDGNGRPLAFGVAAKEMVGRTPGNIQAVRPLKDGVISDYSAAVKMLMHIYDLVLGPRRVFKPRVLLSVPGGVTNVERRAVVLAAREAGAGEAMTIVEPIAAAIGAAMPIGSAGGNLVVHIGAGTADLAVMSLGGVVLSQSLRTGGEKVDDAIARHLRTAHNLMIGEPTAEEIKVKIGSVAPLDPELRMAVRGRDLVAGLPKTVEIGSEEIRDALIDSVRGIGEKLCLMLEETPPELASDIVERGIVLTGGGALLKGLDRLFESYTDIPVRVAENATHCVVIGAGRALEQLELIRQSGAISTL